MSRPRRSAVPAPETCSRRFEGRGAGRKAPVAIGIACTALVTVPSCRRPTRHRAPRSLTDVFRLSTRFPRRLGAVVIEPRVRLLHSLWGIHASVGHARPDSRLLDRRCAGPARSGGFEPPAVEQRPPTSGGRGTGHWISPCRGDGVTMRAPVERPVPGSTGSAAGGSGETREVRFDETARSVAVPRSEAVAGHRTSGRWRFPARARAESFGLASRVSTLTQFEAGSRRSGGRGRPAQLDRLGGRTGRVAVGNP